MAQEEFKKNKKAEPELKLDQKQTASNPAPDPKAEAWAAKNSWFGTDNAMTYTAFDYIRHLLRRKVLIHRLMNIIKRLIKELDLNSHTNLIQLHQIKGKFRPNPYKQ